MDLSGKRILVTGASGFLGAHIVERLADKGCEVVPTVHEFNNLTDAKQTLTVFGAHEPQIVIHCAASVGGIGANQANPGKFFYDNLIMGANVIEACREYHVEKLVMLGTVCSYPKWTPIPFSETQLWRGEPEETNAPYGIAKKALLTMCQAYRQQYGLNAIYLIPTNLYGPRDHFEPDRSHVIPAIMRKCIEARDSGAESITLWGYGTPTRDFLYVEDAAAAIIAATERYDGAEPVNLGSGVENTIYSVAFDIADATGYKGLIKWDTTKPNGQPRRRLDTTRALERFGWQATTELDEGLRRTFVWYAAQRANTSLV